ncbi:DUF551 domain-containing protein [Rhodoferax sp. GW822-FHT02A01]|uniref:DUF551 domain-containing protein n=1 Tax=Rhodoferax sp. GW822-FHT02A01 TaxID=3141537 RepID=UPI00315DF590
MQVSRELMERAADSLELYFGDNTEATAVALRAALAQPETEPVDNFPVNWATMLHYPECWDTAAYPRLRDAIHEALAWSGCSVCKPSPQPAPEPTWRPIESAPSSTEEVLCLSQSGQMKIETGHYLRNMLHSAKIDGEECFYTHWMPLPPAPGTAPVKESLNTSNMGCASCQHFKQGNNPTVGVYDMTCYECSEYYANKFELRAHGIGEKK